MADNNKSPQAHTPVAQQSAARHAHVSDVQDILPGKAPSGNETTGLRRRRRKHTRKGRPRGVRSMGRYPFLTQLIRYINDSQHYKAKTTLFQEERTLRRIHGYFQQLQEAGKASTTNPIKFTEKDIMAFLVEMKRRDLEINTQAKLSQYMRGFLNYCGNPVMAKMHARRELPRAVHNKEITCLTEQQVQRIVVASQSIPGWKGAIMAFVIPTYYYTGLRPSELRKAHIDDIDTNLWTLRVRHPKGEGSWGVQRTVQISTPLQPYVIDFLDSRERRMKKLGIEECDALIPNLSRRNVTGEPYTAQSFLTMREQVMENSGVQFTYRVLRRSYGQHLKDRGVPIDAISKLLGHKSTITTEKYYARIRDSHAFRLAEDAWSRHPLASTEQDALKPLIDV